MKITESTKSMAWLAALVVLAYVLWDTPLLYPVKLFVVVLHEMSHGLAAVLCGGRIVEIKIDPRIGGLCTSMIPGGSLTHIFVASAGYLGSMFWGALILIIGARSRYDRYISLVIGLVVLFLTLLYVRELFGFVFCTLFGLFMLASFRFLPDWWNDGMVKFLGMSSCLYAIVDIKEDLIDRSGIGSDADAIARMLGFPALSVAIGVLWIIAALVILGFSMKIAGSGPRAAGEEAGKGYGKVARNTTAGKGLAPDIDDK
jgi:hypothetical protein